VLQERPRSAAQGARERPGIERDGDRGDGTGRKRGGDEGTEHNTRLEAREMRKQRRGAVEQEQLNVELNTGSISIR
jgi:hypothetical protein